MRKAQKFLGSALGLLLTSVFTAQPASAGDVLPFKGHATAVIVDQVPDGTDVHLTVIGTGQATHMGRFTRTEDLVLDTLDFSISGTITFTTVHGDLLVLHVEGGFVGPGVAAGTATITSGTGRYSGATGSYDFTAVTLDGVVFAVGWDGTIEFAA